MDISSVSGAGSVYQAQETQTQTKESEVSSVKKEEEAVAVSYEKSTGQASTDSAKQIYKKPDYNNIVKQLQEDSENRRMQLINLVAQSLGQQADTASIAKMFDREAEPGKGLKSIFEQMQVDEETAAQAQEDISEDGYWGVEKTSDRLVDMAIALSGNDTSKADLLMDAIKKGYEEAGAAWGDELPEISKQTLDATMEKMNQWKSGQITDVSKDFTE